MNANENPAHPPAADSPASQQSPAVIAVARKDEGQPAIPEVLPVLPIRNLVVFPGTVVPLTVGRAASRQMLEESLPEQGRSHCLPNAAPKRIPGPESSFASAWRGWC